MLELLVLLDDHWQKHRLGSYKLVFLHNTAFNTAEFAKSQVSNQASQATAQRTFPKLSGYVEVCRGENSRCLRQDVYDVL